jgi:hypothetical protein
METNVQTEKHASITPPATATYHTHNPTTAVSVRPKLQRNAGSPVPAGKIPNAASDRAASIRVDLAWPVSIRVKIAIIAEWTSAMLLTDAISPVLEGPMTNAPMENHASVTLRVRPMHLRHSTILPTAGRARRMHDRIAGSRAEMTEIAALVRRVLGVWWSAGIRILWGVVISFVVLVSSLS